MKKLRPFLALLLACWLLAIPALADDEIGGDTSESPPVSDSVEDDSPPLSEETPPEDPPASEPALPEGEESPAPSDDPSDDTPSFPDDSSDVPEDTPPVADDPPDTPDPVPVDPEFDPPVDPLPENPAPETPVDPLPEDPAPVVPETPADPVSETPVAVPDPLPVYPIPDTSVMSPGLQTAPGEIYEVGTEETPAAETHQVFTITTIPEFSLALMDADAGDTMAQIVRDLFGTYTPRVQTVTTYMDGEPFAIEEQYVPGVAGMDWEWIGGFVAFLLLIYCLFRLLGGTVKYG